MSLRKMVHQLVDAGYTFDRVPPEELSKRSLQYEHRYQLHMCPRCNSVNVDIVKKLGVFRGSCYTCGYFGNPAQTAIQAMQLWNEERIQ